MLRYYSAIEKYIDELQLKDEKSKYVSASGTEAFSISMDMLHHKPENQTHGTKKVW